MNTIAFIDMGLKGAISFFDGDTKELIEAVRFKTTNQVAIIRKRDINYDVIIDVLKKHNPSKIVYEMQFMPTKNQGYSKEIYTRMGIVLGLCRVFTSDIESVSPTEWTSALSVGSDKIKHIAKANVLYPALDTRYDGVADSVLIGHYYFKKQRIQKKYKS